MKRQPLLLPALLFMALVSLLVSAWPARAAVTCVEASRYAALARITAGDLRKLAHGLGLTDHGLPASDACRAILLTGRIDAGTEQALLAEIARDHGWLAMIYLAVGDGDLRPELAMAETLRSFRLGVTFLLTDVDYVPDFLSLPKALPASVSYGWTEPADRQDPLRERLAAYLRDTPRRIARAGSNCERGCGTLLAAGVPRAEYGVGLSAVKSDVPALPQGADEAAARSTARHRLGLDGTAERRSFGWVSGGPVSRLPAFIQADVSHSCASRLDYAASVVKHIVTEIGNHAHRDLPYVKLTGILPQFAGLQEANRAVDLCVTQELDRERLAEFHKLCPGATCNVADLAARMQDAAQRISEANHTEVARP